MALTINKVYDANIYVNNANKHGQASEITAPNVTYIMNEYQSLGMFGTARFTNGIEAMECTIKWTYPDNEAQIALANPYEAVDLLICSSKAVYDGAGLSDEQPIRMFVRGFPMQHQGGTFAPKTDVEVESQLAVNYYKLEVDGEEIIEVDTINNILKINGEDIMEERRINLAL